MESQPESYDPKKRGDPPNRRRGIWIALCLILQLPTRVALADCNVAFQAVLSDLSAQHTMAQPTLAESYGNPEPVNHVACGPMCAVNVIQGALKLVGKPLLDKPNAETNRLIKEWETEHGPVGGGMSPLSVAWILDKALKTSLPEHNIGIDIKELEINSPEKVQDPRVERVGRLGYVDAMSHLDVFDTEAKIIGVAGFDPSGAQPMSHYFLITGEGEEKGEQYLELSDVNQISRHYKMGLRMTQIQTSDGRVTPTLELYPLEANDLYQRAFGVNYRVLVSVITVHLPRPRKTPSSAPYNLSPPPRS